MKQLKIKQEFLDNIKNGIKNFEIRKKDYGFKDWTKVELVVMGEHSDFCSMGEFPVCSITNGECFKETLVVELKQTPMTAFEIGFKLNRFIGDENENYNLVWEIYEFIKDYFKQGDTLYWYDLRLVE